MSLLEKMTKNEEPTKKSRGPDLTQEPPSIIQIIDDVLDADKVRKNFFRPSMIHGCKRQNIFHYKDVRRNPQQTPNQLQRILDNGTATHTLVEKYLVNHPDIWFCPEAKIDAEVEGLRIRGSSDGMFIRRSDGYRWGLELKTINADDFKVLNSVDSLDQLPEKTIKHRELIGKVEKHIGQATIYGKLGGLEWITILYWNKNSQALKEFPVRVSEERWEALKKRMRLFRKYLDRKALPVYNRDECSPQMCAFIETCRRHGAPV